MNNFVSSIPPALSQVENIRPDAALPRQADPKAETVSFHDVLRKEIANRETVQFSAHARQRLTERHIHLDAAQMQRIGQAVDLAAAKGARNTLLVTRNYALIVSVPNRTVVTAINQQQEAARIITNIDSTVLLE